MRAPAATPQVIVAVSRTHRVVAAGSWKLFSDAFVADHSFDNGRLLENILQWLSGG
jgi:hypothetical protein